MAVTQQRDAVGAGFATNKRRMALKLIVTLGVLSLIFSQAGAEAAATPGAPTRTCPSPASSPATSGTVFGSVENVESGAKSMVFVTILPETQGARDYVSYLGTLGKPVVIAPDTPLSAIVAATRQSLRRNQFADVLRSMRVAIVGADGSFACGGLPAGPYVVITESAHMLPAEGNPAITIPTVGFYAAVARVPLSKRNAKQRFYSPVSRFMPAATISR